MRAWHCTAAWALAAVSLRGAVAAEPNQTFATRTVLAIDVRAVSDDLTPALVASPNTLLGIRDALGEVYQINDNGSPYGTGTGSGISGVSTNSGSIDFSISGIGDGSFAGSHGESGDYQVFVDVFNVANAQIGLFSETRTLTPGAAHDFSITNAQWNGGYYNVYIDNAVGSPTGGDVDFFTFTGLTAGRTFVAETLDPTASGVDTRLGWFAAAGALIADDDDGGGGLLSLLAGAIPASGALTFAVTGYDDVNYQGFHTQDDPFELRLTIGDPPLTGDFNDDLVVDGEDLEEWRDGFGLAAATADADGDGDVDGVDFLTWQRQLGSVGAVSSSTTASAAAIPEPAVFVLLLPVALAWALNRDRPPLSTHRGQS